MKISDLVFNDYVYTETDWLWPDTEFIDPNTWNCKRFQIRWYKLADRYWNNVYEIYDRYSDIRPIEANKKELSKFLSDF